MSRTDTLGTLSLALAGGLLVSASPVGAEPPAGTGGPVGTEQAARQDVSNAPSETATVQAAAPEGGPRVELRPIDRATVRIVALVGAGAVSGEGRRTGLVRVAAMPAAQHGTGVAISENGLVLTARHVLEGADALAVLFPGGNQALPAEVVWVDPDHDIAFLRIPGPVQDHLEVGQPRTLRISERMSATGYPLDVRERYPAAVSGELSRENNDGRLQLALGVNPGNSGGPVVDTQGELVGILSQRGEPRAGVEGIALIEPLRFILPGYEQARRTAVPSFDDGDRAFAQIIADFVRTSDEQPIFEQTHVPTIDAAAARPPDAEAALVVAAHAWNMYIALLEARNARDVMGLSSEDRETAQRLSRIATTLSRQVYERAPYMRVKYPILRALATSRQPYVEQRQEPRELYRPPQQWH